MPSNKRKRVWWLASYPKSGNTRVRAFICAYLTGRLDINKMFWTISDLTDYYHHIVSPENLSELFWEEMAMLHPAAMLHMAHLQPGPIFCKTHNCNANFYGYKLLGNSITKGAIYMVRDPRDVAVSWQHHNERPLDEVIDDMADMGKGIQGDNMMPHVLTSWSNHVKSFLGTDDFPVLVVRFEDMIENPEKEFEDIVKFLELDFDRGKLEMALEMSSFENLKKQEEEHGFRERMKGVFFNKGRVGTWKDVLTKEQRLKIEFDHATMMDVLGYAPYDEEQVAC